MYMYTFISEKKNSITKLLASSTTQQGSKQKKKEKKNELHQFLCFNIVQSWTISRNTAILKTTDGKSNEGVKEGMDKNLAISSGKKAIILMALVPSPFIATTVQTSKREEKGREREREEWNSIERFTTVYEETRSCAWKWRKTWRYFQFRHRLPDMWKERKPTLLCLSLSWRVWRNGNGRNYCSFHDRLSSGHFARKETEKGRLLRKNHLKRKVSSRFIYNLFRSKIRKSSKIEL